MSLGVGGGELLGLIFTGYVPLASQNPYLIIVYSVTILVTLGNKQFSQSQLIHFLFVLGLGDVEIENQPSFN